jgi:hypothetical protein
MQRHQPEETPVPIVTRRVLHVVAPTLEQAERYLLRCSNNADIFALSDREDAEDIARCLTGKRPETFLVFSFVVTVDPLED